MMLQKGVRAKGSDPPKTNNATTSEFNKLMASRCLYEKPPFPPGSL